MIVVSRQVVNAFQVAGSLADLYLEEPVSQAELGGFAGILAAVGGLLAAEPPVTNTAAATKVTVSVEDRKFPAAPAGQELLKPAAAAAS